ncbi:MAG: hypothetical protein HY366_00900 [Candidatus Aenigmarchaeota archaeon]|nr:hypothetical protein [Candidatus Aenigmarchaeota archaeon]
MAETSQGFHFNTALMVKVVLLVIVLVLVFLFIGPVFQTILENVGNANVKFKIND